MPKIWVGRTTLNGEKKRGWPNSREYSERRFTVAKTQLIHGNRFVDFCITTNTSTMWHVRHLVQMTDGSSNWSLTKKPSQAPRSHENLLVYCKDVTSSTWPIWLSCSASCWLLPRLSVRWDGTKEHARLKRGRENFSSCPPQFRLPQPFDYLVSKFIFFGAE